jgi:hypothetical protein
VTFQELERTLPNGLHDAELLKIDIDNKRRQAILELNLDVSMSEDAREQYRRGRITFSGVEFVAIDPPAGENAFGVSSINAGTGQPVTAPCSVPDLPKDCFLCWLFVVRSNSFIRIAARTVTHEWD